MRDFAEPNPLRQISVLMLAGLAMLGSALVFAAPAGASTWDRAWGKNVNGGGVFGVCTVAASCLAGSSGGLGGEMNVAVAIATDASGNVYLADQNNSRIQKFNSSGTWERAWGKNVNGGGVFGVCTVAASCLAGTTGGLGGELSTPNGVATDASGNVYVAELGNNRIQKFNSSGTWERAWGKNVNGGGVFGVCTVAASCQAGSAGGLGGEMNFPIGVATDSAGSVYVADAANQRIQKFDSTGTFLRAWGKNVDSANPGVFAVCTTAASCQAGSTGGLGGEMNIPGGISTDASANVYVADRDNHRIQKFNSSGTWDRAWGKNVNGGGFFGVCTVAASCQAGNVGGLGGEMSTPRGVAADAAGDVYVADTFNYRIQKFSSTGTFLRTWGRGVKGGSAFGVCTAAASCLTGSAGGLGGEMNLPAGVATSPTLPIYVADTNNNRIQKFLNAPAITTQATANVAFGGQISDQATIAAGSAPTGSITFTAYGPNDTTCANAPAYTSSAVTVSGNGNYNSAPAFTPATAGTYRWRASYSGDANNAAVATACNDPNESSVVAQVTPTISTVATANATIGGQISDQATIAAGSAPTGSITFTAYGPNDTTCANAPAYTSSAVTVSGNGNYNSAPAFTPATAGTYRWRASYSGDANNAAVATACNDPNESSVVAQVTPTISTVATANATIGGQISDQATIAAGSAPTGSITFTAYGPNDTTCANAPAYTSSAVTVSGNGNYNSAPAFTPATAGTYRWRASYSGDANNAAVATACNDPNESSVVAQVTPTISTVATANATIGGQISDQATIAAGSAPTGSITFTAYGPNDTTCANAPAYTSSAVTVSGNGNYNSAPAFTPATAGTYRWRASYSGDANNAAVATACNDPNESSVVSAALVPPVIPPALVTPPAATPTGQRAAALKKCKKKRGRARRNCIKRANKLPV